MTTITNTRTVALSKTSKTAFAIAGLVGFQLLTVYALIPWAIMLWRLLTPAC